jgi:protein phosphatase
MSPNDIAVAVVTDVGPTRERNQDAALVPGHILAGADRGSWAGSVEPGSRALIQVIDGMGGHGGGSLAAGVSAMMMNELLAGLPAGQDPDTDWLASALQTAADMVVDVGAFDPRTQIMGAATAGIIIGARHVEVFHVGDCRVYVVDGGYLTVLTVDHRARTGALTRSLGGTGKRETIEADLTAMDRAVDRRYLLCSDGLTDTLSFEQIKALANDGTPADAARALVDTAITAVSRDNITVAVVDVPASDRTDSAGVQTVGGQDLDSGWG